MCSVAPYADRGVLWPERLPTTFRRLAPSASAAGLVRWWWVASWSFPPGASSTQQTLPFPASNLTFEPGEVNVVGPTTKASTKVLTGQGWVVAALLQPAAVPSLTPHPAETRDQVIAISADHTLAAVTEAVATTGLEAGTAVAEEWLVSHVGELSAEMKFANHMMQLLQTAPGITSVPQAASALGVSQRTLQRLTSRYVGLTPYAIIPDAGSKKPRRRYANSPVRSPTLLLQGTPIKLTSPRKCVAPSGLPRASTNEASKRIQINRRSFALRASGAKRGQDQRSRPTDSPPPAPLDTNTREALQRPLW